MNHDDLRFGRVSLKDLRWWSLIVAAGWAVCVIFGWIFSRDAFYQSYLVAWLFWLGVSLGALGVVMLHHLMGGAWGLMTRRLGEHAAMVLPLMAVLFIPIAIGVHSLFIWSRADVLASDPIIRHKEPYLNVPFFLLRACGYFACWSLLAWYLRSRSLRHDRTADWGTATWMHNVSAGGMVFYFVSMTFGAVDWLMSREPHWYSTVFGFIVVCGQGLSGLCFVIVGFALLVDQPPFRRTSRPDHFNDLGNLLLTFVIVWTYMAFVQLLVTWMGNKQDEIPWYVQRLSNGWWWIGLLLVLLHFFVPFVVLLMRDLKRKAPVMLGLCAGLLVMRAADVFWMVGPSGEEPQPLLRHVLSWMDFVFPIGMGGLWFAAFLWLMDGHPLIPEGTAVPARVEAQEA